MRRLQNTIKSMFTLITISVPSVMLSNTQTLSLLFQYCIGDVDSEASWSLMFESNVSL